MQPSNKRTISKYMSMELKWLSLSGFGTLFATPSNAAELRNEMTKCDRKNFTASCWRKMKTARYFESLSSSNRPPSKFSNLLDYSWEHPLQQMVRTHLPGYSAPIRCYPLTIFDSNPFIKICIFHPTAMRAIVRANDIPFTRSLTAASPLCHRC